MDELLKDTITLFQDSVDFLNRIKDRKLRKERDELVSAIQIHVEKVQHNNKSFNEKLDEGPKAEMYDDVTRNDEFGEVYDDIDTKLRPGESSATAAAPATSPNHHEPTSFDELQDGLSVPAESLTDAVAADFLEMKRESSNPLKAAWQKRWCIIWNNIFFVYESSQDKKQKEAIELQDYSITFQEDKKDSKRKDRCFELRHRKNNKTFEFCANDIESTKIWKENLDKASNVPSVNPNVLHATVTPTTPTLSVRRSITFKNKLSSKFRIKRKTLSEGSSPQHSIQAALDPEGGLIYDDTWADSAQVLETTIEEVDEETYDDVLKVQDGALNNRPSIPDKPRGLMVLPSPPISRPSLLLPPVANNSPLLQIQGGSPIKAFPSTADESHLQHLSESPVKSPLSSKLNEDSGDEHYFNNLQITHSPSSPNKNKQTTHVPDLADDFDFALDEDEYKNIIASDLYQGMWDCLADEENELAFKQGQIVHIISKEYDKDGWWIAKRRHRVGFVPKNYLMEAYTM